MDSGARLEKSAERADRAGQSRIRCLAEIRRPRRRLVFRIERLSRLWAAVRRVQKVRRNVDQAVLPAASLENISRILFPPGLYLFLSIARRWLRRLSAAIYRTGVYPALPVRFLESHVDACRGRTFLRVVAPAAVVSDTPESGAGSVSSGALPGGGDFSVAAKLAPLTIGYAATSRIGRTHFPATSGWMPCFLAWRWLCLPFPWRLVHSDVSR